MSERTALLLASLSHKWSVLVLTMPIVFAIAIYMAGILHTRARVSANRTGLYFATVVRTASCILLVLSMPVLFLALFHFGCAGLKAHSVQCMSNIKQLALGELLYSQDYDEHFPLSASWAEAIVPGGINSEKYLKHSTVDLFRCPAAESPASYGLNAAMGGISISQVNYPADTVLLFDADASRKSFTGSVRDVAWKRHSNAPNIAFTDGHCKSANAFVQNRMIWNPANTVRVPTQRY